MAGGPGLEGMVYIVTARFSVLLVHFVATCTLFFRKIVLIQIELDPRDSVETRFHKYQYINTW